MDDFGISVLGKPILVAVSGGADSMVLVTLLHENNFEIAVAHCNYQLRGAASDADEEMVRNWCEERSVPFHLKRVETKKLADETNRSIQMVARDERYAFFEELIRKHNYRFTALAHHANDRVESLLINVLRGTGIRGLQGMPSKRDSIIRPLLGLFKSEILVFAKKNEVPFRNDTSNSETYYQRNWVRLRLLPMLQQIDSNMFSRLLEFCERVENEIPNYRSFLSKKLEEVKTANGGLEIAAIKDSKMPFTLLKELLSAKDFSSEQVFEVLEIMNSDSGAQVGSATHRVVKDRDYLVVSELETSSLKPKLSFVAIPRSELKSLKTPNNVALIDAELVGAYGNTPVASIGSIFQLRKWRQGDKFKPLGMKGWKKLSDFFIDEKLSILKKEQIWVMTSANEIVWVVGMRLDNRFKVSNSTQKVLKVQAHF